MKTYDINGHEIIKYMRTDTKTIKWRRYRFYTRSIDDYRPLIYNPEYPWWCSGEGEDYVVIVAYLPENEDLSKYWDDACEITFTEENKIIFTSRFPKPEDYKN